VPGWIRVIEDEDAAMRAEIVARQSPYGGQQLLTVTGTPVGASKADDATPAVMARPLVGGGGQGN
jgi:hypothetical protein